MIKRFTPREKKIGLFCLAVVLIYGGYEGIFKPLKGHTAQLDARIEEKQKDLIKNARAVRKSRSLEGEYQAYLKHFEQTKNNELVMSNILSEIEEVARRLDLRIADLKPKRVKSQEFYNQFSVSLTIDSELEGIMQFLHTLQAMPHTFDVEELRLDKGSRRNTSEVKTSLVLSKIYFPSPEL